MRVSLSRSPSLLRLPLPVPRSLSESLRLSLPSFISLPSALSLVVSFLLSLSSSLSSRRGFSISLAFALLSPVSVSAYRPDGTHQVVVVLGYLLECVVATGHTTHSYGTVAGGSFNTAYGGCVPGTR